MYRKKFALSYFFNVKYRKVVKAARNVRCGLLKFCKDFHKNSFYWALFYQESVRMALLNPKYNTTANDRAEGYKQRAMAAENGAESASYLPT